MRHQRWPGVLRWPLHPAFGRGRRRRRRSRGVARAAAEQRAAVEQRAVEQRVVEQRAVEQRAVERRVVERRVVEQRAVERRVVERRVVERVVEQRVAKAVARLGVLTHPPPKRIVLDASQDDEVVAVLGRVLSKAAKHWPDDVTSWAEDEYQSMQHEAVQSRLTLDEAPTPRHHRRRVAVAHGFTLHADTAVPLPNDSLSRKFERRPPANSPCSPPPSSPRYPPDYPKTRFELLVPVPV